MQSENKNDIQGTPDVKREGWDVEELAEESVNKPSDEIAREVLRGDEQKGTANNRDVAGSADEDETPQGREEAKKDEKRGEVENA